jgi:hypothetical protein
VTTLVEHATAELTRLGEFDQSPEYAQSIVDAIEAFASFGHSGGSAEIAIDQLTRLLRREALAPLTDDPAEWEDRTEASGSPWWQNRRDSRAMSHDGGRTYWLVDDDARMKQMSQPAVRS